MRTRAANNGRRIGLTIASVMLVLALFSAATTADSEYVPVEPGPDKHAAYIEGLGWTGSGRLVLQIDEIGWYEGEAAAALFREREPDAGIEAPPNGYYITNDSAQLRELPVAADAEVRMQLYDRTGDPLEADIVWNERISVERLAELLQEGGELDIREFPYHLTVRGGEIIEIVQQYVP
ncbi:hypothetical protein IDH44_25335 [Paenibacillus sp. IB182496]|uniref:Uncharacterized protein n=1 Tax=Paenibacillus sabuli TaxID=2772509 RepID=A0A927BX65_9BACL|nr:hypothetical protein [Paenibacillus sabuli]MBD2848517.1 hypothetical protein [Paenibacillus sabuli]